MLLVELYRPNHAIFYPDGKTDDALEAVNKEHGWNEFIRQILIRLHENKVKHVACGKIMALGHHASLAYECFQGILLSLKS